MSYETTEFISMYETHRELNGIRSRNTEKDGEVGGWGERGMEVSNICQYSSAGAQWLELRIFD